MELPRWVEMFITGCITAFVVGGVGAFVIFAFMFVHNFMK